MVTIILESTRKYSKVDPKTPWVRKFHPEFSSGFSKIFPEVFRKVDGELPESCQVARECQRKPESARKETIKGQRVRNFHTKYSWVFTLYHPQKIFLKFFLKFLEKVFYEVFRVKNTIKSASESQKVLRKLVGLDRQKYISKQNLLVN